MANTQLPVLLFLLFRDPEWRYLENEKAKDHILFCIFLEDLIQTRHGLGIYVIQMIFSLLGLFLKTKGKFAEYYVQSCT